MGNALDTAAYGGQDLSVGLSGIGFDDLTSITEEATLIEEIAWCAREFSTLEGQLILAVKNGDGDKHVVGAYVLSAGTATLFASGRITINLTLPVGHKLCAAHDVTVSGPSYVDLSIVPLGGIVR